MDDCSRSCRCFTIQLVQNFESRVQLTIYFRADSSPSDTREGLEGAFERGSLIEEEQTVMGSERGVRRVPRRAA
jgi:hypothetical protein